jgi:parvulin-like peptidyl-prolyl isomerase
LALGKYGIAMKVHVGKRHLCLLSLCFAPLSGLASPSDVLAVAPGISGQIEVTEDMLERHQEHFPDQDLESAVQDIVDTALLAQLARAKGLHNDNYVQERRREALAWAYLKKVFEPNYLPKDVPDSDTLRVYKANQAKFVHPELVKADHIVLGLRTKKSMEMPKDKFLAEQGRILLLGLAKQLSETPADSAAAFVDAARLIRSEAKALGLTTRGEPLGRFGLEDGSFDRGYDATFRKASFGVKVGGISEVFASPFGWHLVRISERLPAEEQSYDDAKVSIQARILTDVRRRAIDELSIALAEKYPALSDRQGLLRLIKIEPLIRLEAKRSLPKLQE